MQQILDIGELATRAASIGITLSQLSERAGVNSSTAYRASRKDNMSMRSARKLTRALEAEERARLAHLVRLYPREAIAMASGQGDGGEGQPQ